MAPLIFAFSVAAVIALMVYPHIPCVRMRRLKRRRDEFHAIRIYRQRPRKTYKVDDSMLEFQRDLERRERLLVKKLKGATRGKNGFHGKIHYTLRNGERIYLPSWTTESRLRLYDDFEVY